MTVHDVLEQAKALTPSERKELLKLLVDTLDAPPTAEPAPQHSILERDGLGKREHIRQRRLSELRGMGKEIWQGIDAQAYVDLRTPDALHVATAIEAGCDAFLTNDAAIKRVSDIAVVLLDDLQLDAP